MTCIYVGIALWHSYDVMTDFLLAQKLMDRLLFKLSANLCRSNQTCKDAREAGFVRSVPIIQLPIASNYSAITWASQRLKLPAARLFVRLIRNVWVTSCVLDRRKPGLPVWNPMGSVPRRAFQLPIRKSYCDISTSDTALCWRRQAVTRTNYTLTKIWDATPMIDKRIRWNNKI